MADARRAGRPTAVVVSAQGGATDSLLESARSVGGQLPPAREIDQLLATGECASAALLA